ncbi:MAG: MDR family MFS transporter [Acidimicrobiales bacterium]
MGTLIVSLDSTIVGIALPQIGESLHAGSNIQWVVTANLLALSVSMPAAGWVANRLGAKPVFLVSLAAFSVASLCAALAPNLGFLIAARAGQGICAGIFNPVSMTIVLDLFAPDERGRAMGVWGLVAMSAPAVGPTFGGYLVTAVSWHWLFLPNVPIGIIGAIAGRRFLVDTARRAQGKLDFVGLVLGGSGLALFIFGLAQSRSWGWDDPGTIGCLLGGLALLATFTFHALRTPEPLLELRLTRTPVYLSSLLVIGLVTLPQYTRAVFVPLQLERLRGYSALKVGVILTPSAVMTAISMSVGGRLVDRMGARRPAVGGCLLMMIGAAGNAFISPSTSVVWIATSLAIQGMGVGVVMIPVTVVGLNAIADHSMAHATTIRSLTNQVGAALSVAGLFALVNARLASAKSVNAEQSAYNSTFIVAMVVLAIAVIIAWRMPDAGSRPRRG